MINVVNEGVERADPLLQATFEPDPFFQRQHARHDIKGNQTLRAFFLAVHREGNADTVEEGVRLGALLCQSFRRLVREPLGVAQVVRSGRAVAQGHFVVWIAGQKSPSLWILSEFHANGVCART